jgi:hypothetical protein
MNSYYATALILVLFKKRLTFARLKIAFIPNTIPLRLIEKLIIGIKFANIAHSAVNTLNIVP